MKKNLYLTGEITFWQKAGIPGARGFRSKRNAKKGVVFVMLSAPTPRHIVVIKFPRKIDGQVLTCKDIVDKMNHSSWIVPADVVPPLGDVSDAIEAVDAATLKAKTRVLGAAAARKALLGDLKVMVYELGDFVQHICDNNPGHEKEIAQSCGMDTKVTGGRQPNVDSVQATGIDGQVELSGVVRKGKRDNHEFQVTLDPLESRKWYEFPITVTRRAKRLVDNLPINVDLWFRHRLIIDDIPQEWGQLMKIKLTH